MKYKQEHYPRYVPNSKRPFVVWYIFDESQQRFVRQKKESKDLEKANKIIDEITALLKKGYVVNLDEKKKGKKPEKFSIEKAINFFLEIKKSELKHKSFHSYNSHLQLFLGYCQKNKHNFLEDINAQTLNNYFRAGMSEGNTARTRNNKRIFLRTFFNFWVAEGKISKNPTSETKKIKQEKTQNKSFSKEQISVFWEAWKREKQELYFVSRWLFYAFIRPAELGNLRICDIDLRTNKITIPQKVGKTGLGYILITPPILELIQEQELDKRNAHEYVFSVHKPTKEGRWSKMFLQERKKYGLTEDYNLYCWKHTGVKEHFLAGNTLDFIQKQCRHSEIATTLHYLQIGLGLEINPNYEYKQPKI